MRKIVILASALSVIGLMAANAAVAAGMAGEVAFKMVHDAFLAGIVLYFLWTLVAVIQHSIDYGPAAVLLLLACAAGIFAVIMIYLSSKSEPTELDVSFDHLWLKHLRFKGYLSQMTAAFALLGLAAVTDYEGVRLLPTSPAVSTAGIHADLDVDGRADRSIRARAVAWHPEDSQQFRFAD